MLKLSRVRAPILAMRRLPGVRLTVFLRSSQTQLLDTRSSMQPHRTASAKQLLE